MKAKFDIKDMLTIGLIFVVTGIAIAYGLDVMADVKSDMCVYSYNESNGLCLNSTGGSGGSIEYTSEFNASNQAIQGVAKIPQKMPLIATVVVAAIIIGIILRYLVFRG